MQLRSELDPEYKRGDGIKIQFHCPNNEMEKENVMYGVGFLRCFGKLEFYSFTENLEEKQ